MSLNRTVANDNGITMTNAASGTERETRARRAASDLPRNDPTVRRLIPSVTHYAAVWLAPGVDADEFDVPAGYTVVDEMVSDNDGSVCVWIDEVDA